MKKSNPRKILFLVLGLMAVVYPIHLTLAQAKTALKSTPRYDSVVEMYEEKDLGGSALFAGGFINFGFWSHPLKEGRISLVERIESEKNLYRHVLKKLSITNQDSILEVGCGQGEGTALTLVEFNPKEIHGIDFSEQQIMKAQQKHAFALKKASKRLFFQVGKAENIPYVDKRFTKLISVEAAQHFTYLNQFCQEGFRVLKADGKLVVATFFATSVQSKQLLPDLIQTIADGIDYAIPIDEFKEMLKQAGFEKIEVESLGKHVWQGFDRWIAQGEFKESWNTNWYRAYRQGLVDYYMIVATKGKK